MIGSVHVLDIGLLPGFLDQAATSRFLLDDTDIRRLYKPRKRSAHKGDLGHALLICGEKGKIGAAVLATQATLRIGAGRVTTQIPACGYEVLQISVPEAMVITDSNDTHLTTRIDDLNRFDAIGIGPGIGTARETENLLGQVITNVNRPMVLDADALNILANRPDLLKALPPCTLLTPHPGEFKRLFGATDNDAQRTDLASSKAIELGLIILLKGHHSFIALPDGTGYFNPTGNPGMATAGSGDVLLGILTGLLAQGYPPSEAARLGVFLHGRAGDLAAVDLSEESMLASDITAFLGAAYATVYQPNLRS
jgi:NAD(P)H-hydrate epimerase